MTEKKSLYYDRGFHIRSLSEFRLPESLGRSESTESRPGLRENYVRLSMACLSPWTIWNYDG